MDDEKDFIKQFEKEKKQIGNGGYGSVFLVKNKVTGQNCAAKVLKYNEEVIKVSFNREIFCHKTLENPAIVKFKGFSETDFSGDDYPVIFTKYMENGCLSYLFDKIRKDEAPPEWNNTKMLINIFGIILGMKYLHSVGIMHRDLKPSNILLNKHYYPKLTDFGTSRHFDKAERNLTIAIGTPNYMAPEISREVPDDEIPYSFPVDVFSFGMILYEFYTNLKPIIKGIQNNYHIVKNIVEGKRPEIETLLTDKQEVKDLIKRCWDDDPHVRPTFDELADLFVKERKLWPDDVNEEEVEQYLNKFGRSLDDDKIVNYQLPTDEEHPAEYTSVISSTSSKIEFRNILLESIKDIEFVPEDCREPENDEDDVLSQLENPFDSIYDTVINGTDDGDCLYFVADSYLNGENGFPKDKALSFKYMKDAAAVGHQEAAYGLAYLLYTKDEDADRVQIETFMNVLQISIVFGSSKASFLYSILYSRGKLGIEKNYVVGLVYLKYAADLKFPSAMYYYARRLRRVADKKYNSDTIKDLEKKSKRILNNLDVISTRKNVLRVEAKRVYTTIDDPELADYVSRIYLRKVIDFEGSSKKLKREAQKMLNDLNSNKPVKDFDDDYYNDLYTTMLG